MTFEERVARLEGRNRRMTRIVGASALAIAALAGVAAQKAREIAFNKVEIRDAQETTHTILLPEGDVEVGKDLKVKGSADVAGDLRVRGNIYLANGVKVAAA